uniref:RNA helicase n=1 Tax=Glossina palpalis gambiensis TaxID=67801 RepID=A0A1B0BH30_9MUSC
MKNHYNNSSFASTYGLLMSCKKWTSLEKPPLSRPVLDVVESMGFELMTPVQATAIPLLLSRKDVSAEAITGSEKQHF